MAKVWKAAMRDKRDQKVKMVPFLPAPPHPDQNLFFKRKNHSCLGSGQICLSCGLEVREVSKKNYC